MNHSTDERSGFTLIELSIVLVVIGLIAGGVLVGQHLVQAAYLRADLSDIQKYRTATYTFRDKYGYIPGDMVTATNWFGTAPDCTFASNGVAGGYNGTCNGDGNGLVAGGSPANTIELMLFWQHLSLANLIGNGPYGGVYASVFTALNYYGSQKNIPAAPIGGGISVAPTNIGAISFNVFSNPPVTVFLLGTSPNPPASNTFNYSPGLSTNDARQLDLKIDDGYPGAGQVQSFNPIGGGGFNLNPNCATTTNPTTATYNTSYTGGSACTLIFDTKF